jgi:protease-4
MGDPRAQGVLDQMAQERLRSSGATVLAPTPVR